MNRKQIVAPAQRQMCGTKSQGGVDEMTVALLTFLKDKVRVAIQRNPVGTG